MLSLAISVEQSKPAVNVHIYGLVRSLASCPDQPLRPASHEVFPIHIPYYCIQNTPKEALRIPGTRAWIELVISAKQSVGVGVSSNCFQFSFFPEKIAAREEDHAEFASSERDKIRNADERRAV